HSPAPDALLLGILAGTLLSVAQYVSWRRSIRVPGELFVLAQIGVWTYLVHHSGSARSPLFIGYVLEVPLATASIGRRGTLLAAISGAIAYAAICGLFQGPIERVPVAVGVGFLGVSALLSWIVMGVLERQQRDLDDSHAILRSRAHNLAEEL